MCLPHTPLTACFAACSCGRQACWTSGSSQTGRLLHPCLKKRPWRTRFVWYQSVGMLESMALGHTASTSCRTALQQAGQLEKARAAYEQAAQSQEKIGSSWHAAKHLETCSTISRDLGQLDRVADFSRQAGALYAQAGRMAAGGFTMALMSKCDRTACGWYGSRAGPGQELPASTILHGHSQQYWLVHQEQDMAVNVCIPNLCDCNRILRLWL